ncbi:LacI family DNA-binding transcriptional regulator [Glaciecola petra]|uniref:LacI family DNA-binding transcriptional regulator n=1 Tax=Glaciecola petra TaxID=3075602 RepID=A0ABU2ZVE4_9ALTE|nr:LacI family DNA-binding transcriptional regulator [Aestuariibacter sp. P117]MDT0596375.1 LacI family DNA-binding transcriptional regulator [Aestuariibacter sp. P117]
MSGNRLAIKEVARRIGVSTASISYAFNRPEQLSEKRRKEILRACEEMGYFGPNKAARSLRQGKSNIIALILPDELDYMVSDPVASEFIEGVAKALKTTDKHLLLFSGNNKSVNEIIDFVDGFICYGSPRNLALLKQLSSIKKNIVTVDFDIVGIPSINIDNEEAAYQSACLAIGEVAVVPVIIGLRLVASEFTCTIEQKPLIGSGFSISHRRLDGYYRALTQYKISIDDSHIWHIPENTHVHAIIAAKEALSLKPRPTVVMCMSDIIALAVLKVALQMGLRIPEDLRVVGFDGIEQGQQYHPTLTTVQQFSVEKGIKAAELFMSDGQKSEQLSFKILSGETAPFKGQI